MGGGGVMKCLMPCCISKGQHNFSVPGWKYDGDVDSGRDEKLCVESLGSVPATASIKRPASASLGDLQR